MNSSFNRNIIEVNDVFEELSEENKRLLNELMFANKCLNVLITFKTFVDFISFKFKKCLTKQELEKFQKLKEDTKLLLKQRNKQIDNRRPKSNENQSPDDIVLRTEIKVENPAQNVFKESLKTNFLKVLNKTVESVDNNIKSDDESSNGSHYEPNNEIDSEDSDSEQNNEFKSNYQRYGALEDEEQPIQVPKVPESSKSGSKQLNINLNKEIICPKRDCSHKFRAELLEKHLMSEHSESALECNFYNSFCEQKFTTFEDLLNHYSTNHSFYKLFKTVGGNRVRKCILKNYVCPIEGCAQEFNGCRLYKDHMKAHKGENVRKCAYDGCNYICRDRKTLNAHIRLKHVRAEIVNCPLKECKQEIDIRLFKQHLLSYHNLTDFICNFDDCDQRFETYDEFRTHLLTHSSYIVKFKSNPINKREKTAKPNEEFICDFDDCGQRFVCIKELREHSVKHKDQKELKKKEMEDRTHVYYRKQFVCDFIGCGQRLRGLYKFSRHLRSHKGILMKNCPFDQCLYEGMGAKLRYHLRRHHSDPNGIKCPKPGCKRTLSSPYFLRLHLMSFHKQSSIECSVEGCQQKFKAFDDYKSHLLSHSPNERQSNAKDVTKRYLKSYICEIEGCGQQSIGITEYKDHKNTHINVKGIDVCPIDGCNYKSSHPLREKYIKLHVEREHTSTAKCEVEGCNRVLKNKICLRHHMNRVHSRTEKIFNCEVNGCGKAFKFKFQLNGHKKAVHSQKTLACSWPGCDYVCRHQTALKSHQTVHIPNNYVCDWPECGKSVRHRGTLVEHMRTHNNDKCHACEWPGCTFRTVSYSCLVKHRRTHIPLSERKMKRDINLNSIIKLI